jgi:hypothetical protein
LVVGSLAWKQIEVKRSEVKILGEMYVLLLIYSTYLYVCSYSMLSLLFAYLCYFLITRLTFSNIHLMLVFFVLYFCFLCCVFCDSALFLYCFEYCFSFCVVCFLFLYNSIDHCYQVENQLHKINIVCYRIICMYFS